MAMAVCALTSTKLRLSPTNFSQNTEPTTELVRQKKCAHLRGFRDFQYYAGKNSADVCALEYL